MKFSRCCGNACYNVPACICLTHTVPYSGMASTVPKYCPGVCVAGTPRCRGGRNNGTECSRTSGCSGVCAQGGYTALYRANNASCSVSVNSSSSICSASGSLSCTGPDGINVTSNTANPQSCFCSAPNTLTDCYSNSTCTGQGFCEGLGVCASATDGSLCYTNSTCNGGGCNGSAVCRAPNTNAMCTQDNDCWGTGICMSPNVDASCTDSPGCTGHGKCLGDTIAWTTMIVSILRGPCLIQSRNV